VAQIRFGQIGVNGIGATHRGAIDKIEEAQLVACCDIVEAAKQVADERGIPFYTDYRELVARDDVDVVSVCTPHYLHAPMALAALEAGKHVLVEKPIAIAVSEADAMIAAAEANDRLLGVAHQSCTSPTNQLLKRTVESGVLGPLRHAAHISCGLRTNAYYATGAWRGTWKYEGGGVLINQKVHDMHTLSWLLGRPTSVYARIRNWAHDVEVEDMASAHFVLEGDVDLVVQVSNIDAAPRQHLQIVGDAGTLAVVDGKVFLGKPSKPASEFIADCPEAWGKLDVEWEQLEPQECEAGHVAIYRGLIAALKGEGRLIVPGEDGRTALEMVNGMILSGKRDQVVPIPVDRDEYDNLLRELAGEWPPTAPPE